MTFVNSKNWSVLLFAKEIERISAGSEDFNTITVHHEIIEREFKYCSKLERKINGISILPTWRITCKKGLWMVHGTDLEFVKREAMCYFIQYLSDGEYDDILEAVEKVNDEN